MTLTLTLLLNQVGLERRGTRYLVSLREPMVQCAPHGRRRNVRRRVLDAAAAAATPPPPPTAALVAAPPSAQSIIHAAASSSPPPAAPAAVAAPPPPLAAGTSDGSDLSLWTGAEVTVHGLTQHPEFNGRRATVLKPSKPPNEERLEVRLVVPESGAAKGLKMALLPRNLIRLWSE